MSSLANKIRAAQDVAVELYEVPEWDVVVELRSMSARQRAAFASNIEISDNGSVKLDVNRVEMLWGTVIEACCFDPDSAEKVFTADDIDWLMEEKNASVVDSLANACLAISGMGADSESDAGKDSSGSPTPEEE